MMTTFFKKKLSRPAACLAGIALGLGISLWPVGLKGAEASFLNRPYDSDAESGVEALDWIENRDRNIRKNMDTKEQQRLKRDVADMKRAIARDDRRDAAAAAAGTAANRAGQTDGTFGSGPKAKGKNEQPPLAFEGDDIFYDQTTGNVYAKGSVKVTRVDGKRVITEQADGNTKDQNVRLPEGGQFVNITPGESKVDMTGYRILYNYGRETGSLENGRGKVQGWYITGKRIEIFPDQMVIYNGTVSGCSAKYPDYHMSAKKVEIWRDTMVMHSVGYWLGGVQIGWERRATRDLTKERQNPYYPNVGYSSDEGFYVGDTFHWGIAKNTQAYVDLHYSVKEQWRNVYGLSYNAAGHKFTLEYGKYSDSDERYLRKEPTFRYSFSHRIGKSPFTLGLAFERGQWKQESKDNKTAAGRGKDINSLHTEYNITLTPDSIPLGKKLRMTNSLGYSIIKESHDESTNSGFEYNGSFLYTPDKNFAVYASYKHTQRNYSTTLFDYDTENYGSLVKWGLSWRVAPKDRFVVGFSKDVIGGNMNKVDYYWFHNFHCMEIILNYRINHYNDDRRTKIILQFAPW